MQRKKTSKVIDALIMLKMPVKTATVFIVLLAVVFYSLNLKGTNAYFISPKVRSENAAVFNVHKLIPKDSASDSITPEPAPKPSKALQDTDSSQNGEGTETPEIPGSTETTEAAEPTKSTEKTENTETISPNGIAETTEKPSKEARDQVETPDNSPGDSGGSDASPATEGGV